MVLRDFKSKIKYILRNNNGRLIDIAYKANEIIMNSGDAAPELLRYFFEEDYASSEYIKIKEAQIIPQKELDGYIKKYAYEVWSWLDSVLKDRPSTTKFYKSLHEYLRNCESISNERIRAFFLLSVWINPQIPYIKPIKGTTTITEDDFYRISSEICKSRVKAKSVIFSEYSSRTEESSVLLELLNGLTSQEEKAVLLASIIRDVEVRTETFPYNKKHEEGAEDT